MDSTVSETIETQLTTFGSSLLTQFNTIIPLALGIIITVTVVVMAVHWFRKLAGV